MKKLLSLILIASLTFGAAVVPTKHVKAQVINMDTVFTRHIAEQVKDWCYFLGYFEGYKKDSNDHKLFKRIKSLVANQNNGTIVTIDSIPGKWSIRQVEILFSVSGGEYRKVDGEAIIAHLKTKAQLTAKITEMEAPGDTRFKAFRDAGRLWAEKSQ